MVRKYYTEKNNAGGYWSRRVRTIAQNGSHYFAHRVAADIDFTHVVWTVMAGEEPRAYFVRTSDPEFRFDIDGGLPLPKPYRAIGAPTPWYVRIPNVVASALRLSAGDEIKIYSCGRDEERAVYTLVRGGGE